MKKTAFQTTACFIAALSQGAYFVGKWLMILSMMGIVALVLIQIFWRYVLNDALMWPEEITKWCMVWAGYFGAGIALRKRLHISLLMAVDRLKEDVRNWTLFAGHFIVLFFLVYFVILGIQQAISNPAFSWVVNIHLRWPMMGMPLAGFLMVIHNLHLILEDFEKLAINKPVQKSQEI